MTWNESGWLQTWGSQGEITFSPTLRVCYDLFSAYNERRNLITATEEGYDPAPELPVDDLVKFYPHTEYPLGSWLPKTFHLFDGYLFNSLIQGGSQGVDVFPWVDWTRAAEFESIGGIPRLTFDRILELLGDDEFYEFYPGNTFTDPGLVFVTSTTFSPIFAKWANQRYRIFNLLKWTSANYNIFDDRVEDDQYWFRSAQSNVSWADCVTKFINTPDTDVLAMGNALSTHGGRNDSDTNWEIVRKYDGSATITGIPSEIPHAIASYAQTTTDDSINGLQINVYENNDFPSQENVNKKIFEAAAQTVDRHTINMPQVPAAQMTATEPTAAENSKGYTYGIIENCSHVLKWDDGLKYLDDFQ